MLIDCWGLLLIVVGAAQPSPRFRHEIRRVLWILFCCKPYVRPVKIDISATEQHCGQQTAANTRSRSPVGNNYPQNKEATPTKPDTHLPLHPKGRLVFDGNRISASSNNNTDTNSTANVSLNGSSNVFETEGAIELKMGQFDDCGGANNRPQAASSNNPVANSRKPKDNCEHEPFLSPKRKPFRSTGSSHESGSMIKGNGNRAASKQPDGSKVWI